MVHNFWDANVSINWRGIYIIGHFGAACYYITKVDCYDDYGLDLSCSTHPYAHIY